MEYPVDPDVFVDAFKGIGYKPLRHRYIDLEEKRCCALTALALKNTPEFEEEERELTNHDCSIFHDHFFHQHTEARLGFRMDRHQMYSFIEGYDKGLPTPDLEFPKGWTALGAEVWNRLKKEYQLDDNY
jgi:hypothetical protein